MKVKTITPFTDKKANNIERVMGDVFSVTLDRLKEINGTVHGKLVEVIEEDDKYGQDLRFDREVNKRETKNKT